MNNAVLSLVRCRDSAPETTTVYSAGKDSSRSIATGPSAKGKEENNEVSAPRKVDKMFISHQYNDLSWVTEERANVMFPEGGPPVRGGGVKGGKESRKRYPKKNPKKDKAHMRGGVVEPFPLKLHRMLDTCEVQGLSHIVSWLPHGRAFIVHDTTSFVQHVLPEYSNQKKINSFHRQLQLYGFMRITRGTDAGAYYHERFLIGRPYLCHSMVRTKVKGLFQKPIIDPNTEPNFYRMTPLTRTTEPSNFASIKETEHEKDLPADETTIADSLPRNIDVRSNSSPEPVPESPVISQSCISAKSNKRTNTSADIDVKRAKSSLSTEARSHTGASYEGSEVASAVHVEQPKHSRPISSLNNYPSVDPDRNPAKNYLRYLCSRPYPFDGIAEVPLVPSIHLANPDLTIKNYLRCLGFPARTSLTNEMTESDKGRRQEPSLSTAPPGDTDERHTKLSLLARKHLHNMSSSNERVVADDLLRQAPTYLTLPPVDNRSPDNNITINDGLRQASSLSGLSPFLSAHPLLSIPTSISRGQGMNNLHLNSSHTLKR